MSSKLTIKDMRSASVTLVPDIFINEYMPEANGEFVKIYLYLLYVMHGRTAAISLSSIADAFSCTEKDVLRALKYWQKAGILKLEFDSERKLSGLSLLPLESASAVPASMETAVTVSGQESPVQQEEPGSPQPPKYLSPGAIRQLQKENPDIGQLLFLAEQYLKKTLSATDMQRILYFYDELHFPLDLVEYLIEYCVSQNHRSLSYIEKVGLAWHQENVHTVDAAKQRTNTWNKDYYAILKAFGIRGRDPIATEVEFMNRWIKEYGFSLDIIKEACSRTISQTAKPSFKYAEGILSNWQKNHVKSPGDIDGLDQQHQKRVKASEKGAETKSKAANKFNNFHQREYDYEKLEKQLLNQ